MRYLVLFAVIFLGAGCHGKQPKTPVERICTQASTRQAFDASIKVLENMRFSIEKADLEHGIITTRPLPAGQFFEFWRSDTRIGKNFTESNIHSVERTAQIQITTQDSQVCIDCTVTDKRLSMPEKEITGPMETPGLFSNSASGLQRIQMNTQQRENAQWIELGPNYDLQSYIAAKIQKKISKLKGR